MSQEIKDEIKKIGESWEATKKAQDQLEAEVKAGKTGLSEIKEKQDKIDADLNAALDMKSELEKTIAAVKRLGGIVGEESGATAEYKMEDLSSGMRKWMRKGMPQSFDGCDMSDVERKALQTNIDPQGGYTVMPFIGGVEKIIFESSPIRSLATVQTIGTNEYVGYHDDDEFGASWVGEINSRADTDTADIGEFRVPVREMYARFKISERMLEDSSWNVEQWAQTDVADKFGRFEATGFVTGSGILQPQGLVTATNNTSTPSAYVRGSVGALTTASATAITTDEVVTLRGYLKAGYRQNAKFLFTRGTETYVRKLKDGQGNYIWQPNYQIGGSDMLLGQGVVICEDMAEITNSAITIAVGDIRAAYLIVDRVGMSILKDPYTAASTGQTVFHMRKRVGAGIKNFDALKYLVQKA